MHTRSQAPISKAGGALGRLRWELRRRYRPLTLLEHCGSDVAILNTVVFRSPGRGWVGDRVEINDYTVIFAVGGVRIDDDALISANCTITSVTHQVDASRRHELILSPVRIAEFAWIGGNAVVLPGVTIGAGAIVGAGAVVTRDVPPGQTVIGVPARPS